VGRWVPGAVGAAALALALWWSTAGAAEPVLESRPPGAGVALDGAVSVSGTVPFGLADLPAGRYRLRVGGDGLAASVGRLTRGSGGLITVGRFTGPVSVILPPGFSQFHQGETGRGWVFLGGGLAGAAGLAYEQVRVGNADDDANRARQRYLNAVSTEEFTQARLNLLAIDDRRADERNLRTMWGIYTGVVWVGAALESWILTPHPGLTDRGGGHYVLDVPRAGGLGAAVRSALVPGAGQRYLGREGRGNRFAAAVLALGAGSIAAHDAFLTARRNQNDAQRRYDSAETEGEALRWRSRLEDEVDRTRNWDRVRWGVVGATVGVYIWNVVDAALEGGEAAPPSDVSFGLAPRRDGFRAGLTWRIS
jgi:hypothetical protein